MASFCALGKMYTPRKTINDCKKNNGPYRFSTRITKDNNKLLVRCRLLCTVFLRCLSMNMFISKDLDPFSIEWFWEMIISKLILYSQTKRTKSKMISMYRTCLTQHHRCLIASGGKSCVPRSVQNVQFVL